MFQKTYLSAIPILLAAIATAQTKEPLRVVGTFPRGQTAGTNQTQTIIATFNKPMVPLQKLPEGDGTGPLQISPSIKGKYRWLGVNTLSFAPDEPPEIATEYRVKIPSGLRASDGSALSKDVSWSFTTQRPLLLASSPGHHQQWVDVNATVFLRFNLPMSREKVASFIQIREGKRDGTPIPYSLASVNSSELSKAKVYWPDTANVIALRPHRPFAKGKRHFVTVSRGAFASRGSLGMAKEASFVFNTYGEFRLESSGNILGFPPHGSLELRFSNPLRVKELAEHLTFSPEHRLSSYSESDWSTHAPSFFLRLQAETQYTVRVGKELKDQFGQRLGRDVVFTVMTRSFDPEFSMTTGHGILESYGERMYPVNIVNLKSLDVQMLKLSRETIVPTLASDTIYSRDQMFGGAFFDVAKRWTPNVKRNVQATYGLKLDEGLNAHKKGLVLLQVSNGNVSPFLRSDVQVTEMGITAKYSPDDALIWVTKLKDASAVANAGVELRDDANKILWQGTTDAEGFAKAPGWGSLGMLPRDEWSRPRVWVIVSKDDDIAYTSSEWREGIEPYRFGINYDWNPSYEPWQGEIFTDRGIYRPDEEVFFKGIFRKRSQNDWAVRGAEFSLRVYDSRNSLLMLDSARLNEFGSLSSSFKIPDDAHLGYYRVEAVLKQARAGELSESVIAAGSFRVEAYRVSEFEVMSKVYGENYIIGDTVRGSFHGKYLFGGDMKGERIRWRLRYEPTWFQPEGWNGYWFGRNVWDDNGAGPQTKIILARDTILGNKGMLDLNVKTHVGTIGSTGNLVLEGDVTSPSRQTISGRATALMHGAEYYIGIQPSATFVSKDSVLSVRVITVTADGKNYPNQDLEYVILKRQWNSVRKLVNGSYSWQTEILDTTLETRRITTGAEAIVRTFTPDQSGYYLIQVSGKDERGNEVRSDAYFYASGSDYTAWEREDDDRIELIADKREYKPGQTARIIVKNPYEEANALISVEREGVMRHWRTKLKGSAPEIAVPLTEQSLPNVFVSVVMLQGRMSKTSEIEQAKDVGRPSFKIGYVQLNVHPGTRHLSIRATSDKQQYRPGDTVTVSVEVRDASNKPVAGEITLSVADKGVLNLVGYKLPDPFESFYGPRPLAVSTTESRAQIVMARSFGEKGEAEGGGGGADLGGVETRGTFKYTAYWNPTLRTDSTGSVTAKFPLPDNLTTFKIMCVAQSKKNEFGYAEKTLVVAKPLLLQASLPRFVRVGDTFEAGIVVHNFSEAAGTVAMKTSSKGIRSSGKQTTEFALSPGESKEIRRQYEARNVGKATFTFQAALGKETDGLTVSLPIHVPRRKETVAQFEAVRDSLTSKLIVPANVHENLGSIEFTAASTALTGLENSVGYLFDYPYDCIEQKSSRILPIILGKEMVEAFGLDVLKGKDAKAVVNRTINEFRKYQIWNGGFSYWEGAGHDSPFASAFVLYTLAQARRNGYAVSKEMFEKGIEYVKSVLRYQDKMPNYPYTENTWAGTKTLILYTLALAGKPEPAYYETYVKNLDRIPLFAKANLLKAIASSTKNKTMMNLIVTNLLNSAKVNPSTAHFEEKNVNGLEWCWHTDTRTTAIILQALLEADGFGGTPDLPAKIVRWLMQRQRAGRWTNTQENVHVVDALSTFYRKHENDEPKFRAELAVAGRTVLAKMFAGRSLRIERTMKDLDAFEKGKEIAVQMKKEGPGMLYSGLRMSYYPKEDAKGRDEGIAVFKVMEPLRNVDHNPTNSTTGVFRAGTIVKVTLRVITPQQRNYVVLDDPLPAGLEAINTSFSTESTDLSRILTELESQEPEYRWWGSFNHREFRDDRVLLFADALDAGVHTFSYLARATTYGTFELPSTHTEMMYEPEVFGQTVRRLVEIK